MDVDHLGRRRSPVRDLFSRLTGLACKHFPIVKKYKFLLPVFWVYLPARYVFRMLTGKRPKKSLGKIVKSSMSQRELVESVKVFESENR